MFETWSRNPAFDEYVPTWAPALAIACLAAVPRLIRPGLAEYKLDESLAVLNAGTILHQHVLLTQGQGSSLTGAAQGPLFYYFVAAFLAIGHDPRAVDLAIGLANALAVGFAYVVVARSFNVRVAIVSALLFAGSSWSIVFSRKIWPNDLLAPLAVVALWGILRVLDPASGKVGLGWSWLAVAAMGSLNLSAWPLVLIPALVQVAVPSTRRGRALVGSLAGIGALAPAVGFELPTFAVIFHDLAVPSGHPHLIDLSPLWFIVQLAGTDAFQYLAGPAGALGSDGDLNWWVGTLLRLALYLGGAVAAAWTARAWLARRRPVLTPQLLILLWWVTPALAAVDRPVQVFIHHFLGTVPCQFILVAIAFDWLARLVTSLPRLSVSARRSLDRAASAVAGALSGAAAAVQLHTFALLLAFVQIHPAGTYFGVPLGSSLTAVAVARAAAAAGPVYLLSDGDEVGVDTTPTVMASLVDRATIHDLNADRTLVFPPDGTATYLVSPDSLGQLEDVLTPWQAEGGPLSRLEVLSGGYAEFHGGPVGPDFPTGWTSVDVEASDMATIVGFRAPRQIRPGVPFEVDVLWRIGRPAQRPDLESVFAHLVDDDDVFADGEDYAPLPTTTWVNRAAVLSRFTLNPPSDLTPGRYWIDFGRYRRPGIQPIRLGDPSEPNGPTSIRLGPLAIAPPAPAPTGLQAASATFGDQIALDGWQIEQKESALQVELLWRAIALPSDDYTVFVHLVAADGRIVAQHDSQPLDGAFPTSTWLPGDRALDVHPISIAGVPAGTYRLDVGLYVLTTGQRLSVGGGDTLTLGAVRLPVQPAG